MQIKVSVYSFGSIAEYPETTSIYTLNIIFDSGQEKLGEFEEEGKSTRRRRFILTANINSEYGISEIPPLALAARPSFKELGALHLDQIEAKLFSNT